MKKKIALASLVLIATTTIEAQLQWPAVKTETKPWTRWWWEGNAVDTANLSWNLEQYRAAGLGGVELTPIYGVKGTEQQFIDFLSPKWMSLLQFTLRDAKKKGLGVDLANGTGWPFGGPFVKDEDASKSIYYKTYQVEGGRSLSEPIEYIRESFVRTANTKPVSADTLLQPAASNKNLQGLALDQVQFAGKLPLRTLVAYSGDRVIDLSKKVDRDGRLNWTAPPGTWTLYALFEGLHGKMVERAAPGGEGYAIDHFSAKAARNYFKHFDAAFKGYDLSHLRSFFNDSYEVDDARGDANWTPEFLQEFKRRKGYDLRHHLPALFGKDEAEKNSRIIYDYRSVIDELLLEYFTQIWKQWAVSKGKMVRNQSHGSPANTLDLYSVVDIPETEGIDILRFKFATSAANVTGKRLVSSESATWLNEHFLSSWGDVKKAVDLFFLGGVNHIFYHGTEYSPKEASWPGWLFYAAVHFQPTNPQWKDFHALNSYVTRVQSFLQEGKPDNDVLLYYPIVDRYSQPGNNLLQHFDGMEKNFENTDFEHVSKTMLEKGYGFDFFSERQLRNFRNAGSGITTGGNSYKTILLPANKLINEASFRQLIVLARQGANILVYKQLPEGVPGWGQFEKRQAAFQQLLANLKFEQDKGVQRAKIGKGSFYVGEDLDALLNAAGVQKENWTDKGLSVLRRKNDRGKIYFINNRTSSPLREWINLPGLSASVGLFDAITGRYGLARQRKAANDNTEILIELQPFESVIVQTYTTRQQGREFHYMEEKGHAIEINGNWNIRFIDGGPSLPNTVNTTKPGSWTELDGDAVKNFSGTAVYTINFEKPAANAGGWILDLGKVNETAEVILNGKTIATLVGPVYRTWIAPQDLQANNKLEILVSNLMANRIAYMDRNNMPWKIFYNINMQARKRENLKDGVFSAAEWTPLPSGLSGPVRLLPVAGVN